MKPNKQKKIFFFFFTKNEKTNVTYLQNGSTAEVLTWAAAIFGAGGGGMGLSIKYFKTWSNNSWSLSKPRKCQLNARQVLRDAPITK